MPSVAFLHYGQDDACAQVMLRAVRQHLPAMEAIQLTDMDTPVLSGCSVQRLPLDGDGPSEFRLRHLELLPRPEVLILDTDVVVQADLLAVFALPFQVALTWRDGPIYDNTGFDLTTIMPINCGVMWSRSRPFWAACRHWLKGAELGWYSDQMAVAELAPQYDVLRLHCDNYNYTPRRADEDVSRRRAVHYKGQRKGWMLNHGARHLHEPAGSGRVVA